MVCKKFCFLIIILILLACKIFALDLNIRATPELAVPVGSASAPFYSLGFGGALNADIELFNVLSVGPEINYWYIPLLNTGTNLHFINGGASLGAYAFPLSRLKLQLKASGGAYQCLSSTSAYGNMWWKIHGDAAFRFNPTFAISGSAGYIRFEYNKDEPLYTGILAGISFQVSIDTQVVKGNIAATLKQDEPVFPLFYGIYKQNAIGTITVVNNESAEIRNLNVSFRAGDYTSSLLLCGSADLVKKRQSVNVPLYADFAGTIQNFTENGKIPGELVITYNLLGTERKVSKTVVVPVYNRNTLRWTDSSVLASYISPDSPEVLDYSKYIVGIARENLRTGLNRNMQFAMYLFEGLKAGGISVSNDKTTPYASFHLDSSQLDYIQYPFQTLAYHSGDLDDLGILYAAALESVGLRSAIIPLKDDFVVAVSLAIAPDDAKDLFATNDNLLTIADEVWIPLSMSVIREGFVNSWYKGIQELNAAFSEDVQPDVIIISEAWKTYPAASIVGTEAKFEKPGADVISRAVDTDLMRYISAEFGPKIQNIKDQLDTQGTSATLYNQLGLLYIRAGMYDEAKVEYQKAAALKSVSALINLGNICLLEKDFKTAGVWFKKALELQPDSKGAQTGLDRVNLELAD